MEFNTDRYLQKTNKLENTYSEEFSNATSFKEKSIERDCFMKEHFERDPLCPASVDQTTENTAHLTSGEKSFLCL